MAQQPQQQRTAAFAIVMQPVSARFRTILQQSNLKQRCAAAFFRFINFNFGGLHARARKQHVRRSTNGGGGRGGEKQRECTATEKYFTQKRTQYGWRVGLGIGG